MYSNINPEKLLKIPGNIWIYWKDNRGNYLGCNDLMADHLGFSSRKDICGMKDNDLPLVCNEETYYYQICDQQVISSGITQQFHDTATLDRAKLNFLVLKSPIINSKMIVGVVGFSYILNTISLFQIADIQLNERAIEMLRLLVRGKTAKEIAIVFKLSHRTVEHYLENLRKKFKVTTRAALIDKVIDYLF